jgi:hypothetical protein
MTPCLIIPLPIIVRTKESLEKNFLVQCHQDGMGVVDWQANAVEDVEK